MTLSRALRPRVVVPLCYLGLTLAFTHPLALHFASRYPGERGGDGPIYVWNLWWVKTAITRLHTSPLQTDFIFFPTGIGLALHTLALLHGWIFIPLSGLFGDVVAANLIVLATFMASALGAYALARQEGAAPEGAFLAGFLFAFCPYRLARLLGHYDLLSTQWLPLFALAFLRLIARPSIRASAVITAAALAAACGYTDLTYLVFLVLLSLVALVFAPRGAPPLAILARAALVGATTAAILSPLLLEAWEEVTSWSYPTYPGSDRYVADLAAYVLPGPRQTLLGAVLGRGFDPNTTETVVFVGWVPLALLLAASVLPAARRARPSGFWPVLASLGVLLSLGDTLHVLGHDTRIRLVFPLLRRVPLLNDLRAPSRFSILVVLCLGVMLAVVWTRWMERVRGTAVRVGLTCAVASLMGAEFLAIPVPLFPARGPAVFEEIAKQPGDFTVAEVPGIDQVPSEVLFHQTIHQKRVFIGTAARVPVEKMGYFFGLPLVRPLIDLRKGRMRLEDALDPEVLRASGEAARFLRIRYFVIARSYLHLGLVRFLESALPVDVEPGDALRTVLRVRLEELPPLPTTLEAGSPASRLYYESGWAPPEGEGRAATRRANAPRSTLLFQRPSSGPLAVTLRFAAAGGVEVAARFRGRSLGRVQLHDGSELSWKLPAAPADRVERLELVWSAQGAQVAFVRLEATRDP